MDDPHSLLPVFCRRLKFFCNMKQFIKQVYYQVCIYTCNVVNDTLQSALVPGSGRRGELGGEDGLNGYFVELHHHCLWVVEMLLCKVKVE